jgi:hypothetical protein
VILRRAHLEALVRVSREVFVDRMIAHIRDGQLDPEKRDEAELRELAWRALAAAESIAIVTEAGICRYVELWLAHGEMCDRRGPELLTLIDDGGLDEAAKLAAIAALVEKAALYG